MKTAPGEPDSVLPSEPVAPYFQPARSMIFDASTLFAA